MVAHGDSALAPPKSLAREMLHKYNPPEIGKPGQQQLGKQKNGELKL